MTEIICQKCAKPFYLSVSSYWNYSGEVRCTNCGAFLIVSIRNGELKSTPILKSLEFNKIPNAPENMNKDLYEAQVCHAVGANKACVVMCGRTLEQICDDKDAKGKTLDKKIKDLLNENIISSEMFKMFDEIRYFRNHGAHLKNDLLGGVTKDDSSLVLEVTIHLSKHIYEIPEKMKKLIDRRTK